FILLTVFMISMAAFLWREKKAFSPMMPLRLWQDKLVALANIATFTSGAIMIGLSSFLPTYVQGVMGRTAVVAGFTLTMMSVGWPLASTFAGYIFLKICYRKTAIIGGTAFLFCSIFFIILNASKGPVWSSIGSFVI